MTNSKARKEESTYRGDRAASPRVIYHCSLPEHQPRAGSPGFCRPRNYPSLLGGTQSLLSRQRADFSPAARPSSLLKMNRGALVIGSSKFPPYRVPSQAPRTFFRGE